MNTKNTPFQQLLHEATGLYIAEKQASEILASISSTTVEDCLSDGIARDLEENRAQCARLEGFLAALDQIEKRNGEDARSLIELSLMLKRITSRHRLAAYQTAIFIAISRGEYEKAEQLRLILSHSRPVLETIEA